MALSRRRRLKYWWQTMAAPMPIYTTRPSAGDSETGSLSISIWIALLAMLLVLANVILWGVIGVVMAVGWWF